LKLGRTVTSSFRRIRTYWLILQWWIAADAVYEWLVAVLIGVKFSAVGLWSTRDFICTAMTSLPVSQWRAVTRQSVIVAWDENDIRPLGGASGSWLALSMMGRTSTAALSYLHFRFQSPATPPPSWPSAVSELSGWCSLGVLT